MVEFIDGKTQVYNSSDLGIMTNEPPYPFHQQNIAHLEVAAPSLLHVERTHHDCPFVRTTISASRFPPDQDFGMTVWTAWCFALLAGQLICCLPTPTPRPPHTHSGRNH